MNVSNEFLFDADFQCVQCGSIIGVRTRLAIVKSHGIEVQCRHCKTGYLVTEEGAIPIHLVDTSEASNSTSEQREEETTQ